MKLMSNWKILLRKLRNKLIELENFIQLYVQVDLITGELKLLMQKAVLFRTSLAEYRNTAKS